METVRKSIFKIIYDGKDITTDITPNVISIVYNDNDEKEADNIEITIEDVDALWRNSWYPQKGSTITLSIGYDSDNLLIQCGTFEIDEITISGPPDVISIRAIATSYSKAMRTKKSKSFENQTLRQIAQYVAGQNGLTLVGNIANVNFIHLTQNREKDLSFLARIANEYGYLFSVRDKKLTFISQTEIENGNPVLSVDRTELRTYSIRDKTSETYVAANVAYNNPGDGQIKGANVQTLSNKDNVTYKQIASNDTLEIRTKAETPAQADLKAKAALHYKNSNQREGSISVEGAPTLLAGNNFTLTGLGELSGKYYIKKSSHRIDKGGGYVTTIDAKQISAASSAQKSKQGKTATAKYTVQNLSNKDQISFKQITPVQ